MLLKCIMEASDGGLTVGRSYEVRGFYGKVGCWVSNDKGVLRAYPANWFVHVDEVRSVKARLTANKHLKKCISFDFDGTLVSMVYNKEGKKWVRADGKDVRTWNLHVVKKVVEAKKYGFLTAIVSERSGQDIVDIINFKTRAEKAIEGFKIDKVVPTNTKSKGHILESIGSVMHWDDNFKNAEDIEREFQGMWVKVPHPSDVKIIPSPRIEITEPERYLLPQPLLEQKPLL